MVPIDLSTSPWLIRIFDRVPLSLPVITDSEKQYVIFSACDPLSVATTLSSISIWRTDSSTARVI